MRHAQGRSARTGRRTSDGQARFAAYAAPAGRLTEGQPLVVDVTTPAYDSYVNIDYYQLDGSVVHLVPNAAREGQSGAAALRGDDRQRGRLDRSKPFGSEMIVLLITPAPLFDTLRPESEPRADYLRAVEKRLAQIAGKYRAATDRGGFRADQTRKPRKH